MKQVRKKENKRNIKKENKGKIKNQKILDDKFEKYAAMLPQSYYEKFQSKSRIPKEIANKVQQIRNERNLSQEELARMIQENIYVISNLEECKGSYNPKIVEKIEEALDVTIIKNEEK